MEGRPSCRRHEESSCRKSKKRRHRRGNFPSSGKRFNRLFFFMFGGEIEDSSLGLSDDIDGVSAKSLAKER